MSVQNPHDRFFRESFGRLEIVQNYLEEYLPENIRTLLDLDLLALQEGSFIDEAMQEHQTDLLYQVRLTTGADAFIYFLFEHKSYPDPLVGLQLLRYMVRFWERQEKETGVLVPIIRWLSIMANVPGAARLSSWIYWMRRRRYSRTCLHLSII